MVDISFCHVPSIPRFVNLTVNSERFYLKKNYDDTSLEAKSGQALDRNLCQLPVGIFDVIICPSRHILAFKIPRQHPSDGYDMQEFLQTRQ